MKTSIWIEFFFFLSWTNVIIFRHIFIHARYRSRNKSPQNKKEKKTIKQRRKKISKSNGTIKYQRDTWKNGSAVGCMKESSKNMIKKKGFFPFFFFIHRDKRKLRLWSTKACYKSFRRLRMLIYQTRVIHTKKKKKKV